MNTDPTSYVGPTDEDVTCVQSSDLKAGRCRKPLSYNQGRFFVWGMFCVYVCTNVYVCRG